MSFPHAIPTSSLLRTFNKINFFTPHKKKTERIEWPKSTTKRTTEKNNSQMRTNLPQLFDSQNYIWHHWNGQMVWVNSSYIRWKLISAAKDSIFSEVVHETNKRQKPKKPRQLFWMFTNLIYVQYVMASYDVRIACKYSFTDFRFLYTTVWRLTHFPI